MKKCLTDVGIYWCSIWQVLVYIILIEMSQHNINVSHERFNILKRIIKSNNLLSNI